MKKEEIYQFDLVGCLVAPRLFSDAELEPLIRAVDDLEGHFRSVAENAPKLADHFGQPYSIDAKTGASVMVRRNPGLTLIVEDFIGASKSFDMLIGNPKLLSYVNEMVEPPHSMASGMIFYRDGDSYTPMHMGGPVDARSRYSWIGTYMQSADGRTVRPRHIHLLQCRIVIALHDTTMDDGPFCFVPGSHKSSLHSPHGDNPYAQPGLQMALLNKGDVLFFTENLRHGGLRTKPGKTRKSLHLMFSEQWVPSQSPVHYNGYMRVHADAWERYTDEQKAYFPRAEIFK